MPKTPPRMKLSPEEETFLRQWMYDEVHFQDFEAIGSRKILDLCQVSRISTLGGLEVLAAEALTFGRQECA